MIDLLIQKAKSWDLLAFGDLYDTSYDRVYRFLFYRTLDTVATEDLISDVYMKAMKSITRFRWESIGEWYSWILQIAYTTLIDSTRRHTDTTSFDELVWEPSYTTDMDASIDDRDTLTRVLNYMTTLTARDRQIVMMRIWDDLSYEEIASITWESVSNSKKIVSRTLQKISANVSVLSLIIVFSLHALTK
jgi:RNA polymerase sigma-70 factor (ECF subfamily)